MVRGAGVVSPTAFLLLTTFSSVCATSSLVASELGMDYTSVLASMKGKWVERTDTTGIMTVAYISEIISEGHAAPIEYSTPSIKDMIISARKQQLVSTLERDLLNEARENGQFVILK